MKFGSIFLDPAWQFANQRTRAATSKHYEDMMGRAIASLDIGSMAADASHCYLWTTATHLPLAFECLRSWGFNFKLDIQWVKTRDILSDLVMTEKGPRVIHRAVVPEPTDYWNGEIKLQIGLGNYYRHAHERLLFATRGPTYANVHAFPTVIFAPREEHSAKPEIFQSMAELLSPGPGVELFARRPRDGWCCVGSELGMTVEEFITWNGGGIPSSKPPDTQAQILSLLDARTDDLTAELHRRGVKFEGVPTNQDLLERCKQLIESNCGDGDGADVHEFNTITDELLRRGIRV
jgi:N6-adenosine-specific RNA methylase IME4